MSDLNKRKIQDRRFLCGFYSQIELKKEYRIDLKNSFFPVFDSFRQWMYGKSKIELQAIVIELDLQEITTQPDFLKVYTGWSYWAAFYRGYLEYQSGKQVDDSFFYKYFLEIYSRPDVPKGLVDQNYYEIIKNKDNLTSRIKLRYKSLAEILDKNDFHINTCIGFFDEKLKLSMHPNVKILDEDVYIQLCAFDGYHRVFSCLLANVNEIPCLFESR